MRMYYLVHDAFQGGPCMLNEFSLAYLTVAGLAPPAMIDLADRVGYDCVGLRLIPVTDDEVKFPLAEDRRLLRQTKQQLASTGIRVLDVELFRLTPHVDIATFVPALDACAELGARHIIAQAPDASLARATEHMNLLCDAALQRGLGVSLEFVTWTETPDLQTAARIIAGCQCDNAGILVDTLHFSRSGCSPTELAMLPREWLRYAQVCDAPLQKPATVEGLIFAARNERQFLGEGELDLKSILAALPEHIPYSIELPRTTLAREIGFEQLASRALTTTRRFMESVSTASTQLPHTTAQQLQSRR
jgi:sugar phosphate isomerase/epimerase